MVDIDMGFETERGLIDKVFRVAGNSEEDVLGWKNLAYAARHGCIGALKKFYFDNYCIRNACEECLYEDKREGLVH